jgi:molybdenum cofactor cytidylyltransferase
MSVTGILLAAGAGKRFGGGKLIAQVQPGVAMCVAACRNLRQAVDEIVAVVRPGDSAISAALASAGARVIECANAHEGMGPSLACGVKASSSASGWVVALGDMPFIQPATIAAVAQALRDGKLIAAPIYQGERGHPVGFAVALRAQLLECVGDTGARDIIKSHASQLHRIETIDAGVLADIDTPAQLAGASRRADSSSG